MAETNYLVRSVARDRTNRTVRAMQVGRRGFVQKFAGGTILVRRARPARLPEAVLKANLAEFKKAVAEHLVAVTTLDGRPVDLNTLEAGPPAAASSPRPNPPLDSAKNDKNENIGYDVPPTPEGTTMNAPLPELLRKSSQPEGEEPEAEPVEQKAPEASPPAAFHHGGKYGKKGKRGNS